MRGERTESERRRGGEGEERVRRGKSWGKVRKEREE